MPSTKDSMNTHIRFSEKSLIYRNKIVYRLRTKSSDPSKDTNSGIHQKFTSQEQSSSQKKQSDWQSACWFTYSWAVAKMCHRFREFHWFVNNDCWNFSKNFLISTFISSALKKVRSVVQNMVPSFCAVTDGKDMEAKTKKQIRNTTITSECYFKLSILLLKAYTVPTDRAYFSGRYCFLYFITGFENIYPIDVIYVRETLSLMPWRYGWCL